MIILKLKRIRLKMDIFNTNHLNMKNLLYNQIKLIVNFNKIFKNNNKTMINKF
jgi:hypothetical protein